ncbi:MAG: leucyl aminopeptidase [bacterium]
MKIQIYKGDFLKAKTDLLVVGIFEDDKKLKGPAAEVNAALKNALQGVMRDENFKGEFEKTLLVHPLGRISAKRVCLIGLGKSKEFTTDRHRRAFARMVQAAKNVQAESLLSPFFGWEGKALTDKELSKTATEGVLLGTYSFEKYKKKEKKHGLRNVSFMLEAGMSGTRIQAGIREGTVAAQATNFARDLVNEPGNVINPVALANTARQIAKKAGLSCRILNVKQISKLGMGAYLGVAQGSINPPRFIHLTYRPRGKSAKKSIAIVGKGITFDSGGLSIKPSDSMQTMKIDKSGACTVLAVMQSLPQIRPNVTVHGIIAAAENMPGGRAQRPDDIVRTMNGKTIEVLNTDAEGRLTLADALCYAGRLKPYQMIDLATLTGACVVALGEYTSGVMGNDQAFIDKFLKSAKDAGEQMWPLPFDDNMKEKLKSSVADLKNIGNRYGGAITAGMFLREFVGDIPWIHIDIAGPAFHEKGWGCNPGGATGVGVRSLLHYISSL